MGALPLKELVMSKIYDPEESLAEGLTKEGRGSAEWAPCFKKN